VRYDIPPDVIYEAIVNAVAHRDYTSAGAVQVSVFSDRVEVWNPGALPSPLTLESLRHPHGSIARNHRLCEAFFLAQYIEKYGTGTLMMIRECLFHQLPEPAFAQRGGEFTITLWRDWLTENFLASQHLNERQYKAISQIKIAGSITSGEYQKITQAIPRTATRDLDELVSKGLLVKRGRGGRGAHYVLAGKSDINRTNRTLGSEAGGLKDQKISAANKPFANKPIRTGKKQKTKRPLPSTPAKGSQKDQSRKVSGTHVKKSHNKSLKG
jgi:predicted HTH transcriptional regulator